MIDWMVRYSSGDCLLTAGTLSKLGADCEERLGLAEGHCYCITQLVEIEGYRLIQLRNPWGHLCWKGRFSYQDQTSWSVTMRSVRIMILLWSSVYVQIILSVFETLPQMMVCSGWNFLTSDVITKPCRWQNGCLIVAMWTGLQSCLIHLLHITIVIPMCILVSRVICGILVDVLSMSLNLLTLPTRWFQFTLCLADIIPTMKICWVRIKRRL